MRLRNSGSRRRSGLHESASRKQFVREWVKLPSAWILNGGLRQFGGTEARAPEEAEALRLLVCISLMVGQEGVGPSTSSGSASISYTQFCRMTGASRLLVANGLRRLVAERLVTVDESCKVHSYVLAGYDGDRWAKVPRGYLCVGDGSTRLAELSLRYPATLDAMKIYLLLLSLRSRETGMTQVGHSAIEKYTGITAKDISPAISVLVVHRLVGVARNDPRTGHAQNIANHYIIAGLQARGAYT